MSVQTEIDRIITAVEDAHIKVSQKGGNTSRPYLVGNLASAIESIPVGKDPVLQQKTVTPTTAKQTVTHDSGYDGLSKVTVNAMPTATQATPSISVNSSGLITASATQTAGYVEAGTKSATKQLTTQAAKTIAPSTSQQTAVAKGVYTTGAVTVAAIPSTYVKPSATKAATTYTPNTADQTIAAGTYCSGAQTIKGDANLVAGNIKSGVSIFGVAGSYEGSGGGGSVETCTGTVKSIGIPNTNSVWFLNSDMQPDYCTPGAKKATTFTAIKGSFVFIYGNATSNKERTLNGVTLLYSNVYSIVVSIDSDNFSIVT